jgi:hypothetical protein
MTINRPVPGLLNHPAFASRVCQRFAEGSVL